MTDIKQLEVADEKPPSLCNLIRNRVCPGISRVLFHGVKGMDSVYCLPNPNIALRHLY